jgi:hypothetical protein
MNSMIQRLSQSAGHAMCPGIPPRAASRPAVVRAGGEGWKGPGGKGGARAVLRRAGTAIRTGVVIWPRPSLLDKGGDSTMPGTLIDG